MMERCGKLRVVQGKPFVARLPTVRPRAFVRVLLSIYIYLSYLDVNLDLSLARALASWPVCNARHYGRFIFAKLAYAE